MTVRRQAQCDGAVEWNGLAFLFASYVSVGTKAKDNAIDDKGEIVKRGAKPKSVKEITEGRNCPNQEKYPFSMDQQYCHLVTKIT